MRDPLISIKVDGQGLVTGFHIRQQVCISTDTIFQKGKSRSYARLLTNVCLRKALQLDVSKWHAPQAITQHRVGIGGRVESNILALCTHEMREA